MDDFTTRRMPLRRAKRIALNVTVSPETLRELARIGEGNRSAAIEILLEDYMARFKRAASLLNDPAS